MNLTVKVSHFLFYILILLKLCYFSYHCSVKSHFEPHPITRHNLLFKTTPYLVIIQHFIFNTSSFNMIQIHEFKTLALPSFPIQSFFFIFNSYSHTHSNLKRASSIPKLFFFFFFFLTFIFFNSLICTYSTSILHFIQIHEFETLSFFLHAFFFFKHEFDSRLFFLFFHSFVHTYFTITYTRQMLLKHGFDSQVFFFFTHFLLHVLASSIIILTFKIFFTTRFFSLHTLLYYFYFFLFLSIIHTNKFLTLKQNANKIYLH